jgi:uncharacterized membrane protein YkoI
MKKIGTVAAASIGAFAVGATVAGGIAIASADANSATDSPSNSQQGWGRGPIGGERGPGQLVTGEDAQKATDAALAAVSGTADHVHKAPDGTYRVMVTTAEGKHVVVTLDASFAVTGQQEMQGRGPGHGRGTPATEQETQQATDAALARIPGATVLNVFKTGDGDFAVMVRKDNGAKRVVLLDENYAVQSVENPRKNRGERRGHHGRLGKDVIGPKFKKAEASALAEVPGGTVMDVRKNGKKYFAVVRRDDGSVVIVTMNSAFKVTGTQDMNFPRDGRGPAGPASSATAA